MKENNIEKIVEFVKSKKEKIIIVLKEIFKEQNISKDNKIKLDNRFLKELFLIKENDYYIFDFASNLTNLYDCIDFDDFVYEKLYIDQKNLDLMAKYNIKFYADRIFNKNVSKLKFNGVYVEGNFDGFIINGANFKGVKGKVIINPQKVNNKNLYRAILADTYIDGSFEGCYILGTNFKNAKGEIRINPQFIKNKDFSGTILDGVYIEGSFDGCIIYHTNFENHKGKALINPQTIENKELTFTSFSGVHFFGSFEGCKLYQVDFTDSTGAYINLNKIIGEKKWGLNCNFRSAKLYNFGGALYNFVENRYKSEMELSKFAGATLVYTIETKHMVNDLKENPNFKDAIFVNEDEQLETDIRNVFKEEIELQKVKQKVKKINE